MINRRHLVPFVVALALQACQSLPVATHASATGPIALEAGGAIERHHDAIGLSSDAGGAYSTLATDATLPAIATAATPVGLDALAKKPGFSIVYVARISPVTVNGTLVQANDILIQGDVAYVAYNESGPGFAGAIQIVDIQDADHPVVRQTLRFADLEINALALDGNRLIFAGAANPDKHPFHAFVGALDTKNPTAAAITDSLHALDSYAATKIRMVGDRIYIGVGAKDGGVDVLDRSLTKQAFLPDADVRSLAPFHGGVVALGGATDSAKANDDLLVVNGQGVATSRTLPFAKLTDYTKAAIEVFEDDTAALALSNEGMALVDLNQPGAPLFRLPNPSSDPLEATNSLSADGDLLFTANGQYGFRVLRFLDGNHDQASSQLLGHHALEGQLYDGQRLSANQIAYNSNTLCVATGLGGVHIYRVVKGDAPPTGSGTWHVGAVKPSVAAPGSVFDVYGDGFTADAKLTLGGRSLKLCQAQPGRLAALVPADYPVSDEPQPVVVSENGEAKTATNGLVVSNCPNQVGGGTTDPDHGLRGNVYRLPVNTDRLPTDLASRKPDASYIAKNLDIAPREFNLGFPGIDGSFLEWYAIRFPGQIQVPVTGTVGFRLNADDGAKLYIDGHLVVNDDGIHPPTSKDGQVTLAAGRHDFLVEFFQGPRYLIALQCYWTLPGKPEAIVPAKNFFLTD